MSPHARVETPLAIPRMCPAMRPRKARVVEILVALLLLASLASARANWAWTDVTPPMEQYQIDRGEANINTYYSIASSPDGLKLAAVGPSTSLRTSTNGGANWTVSTLAWYDSWYDVAMSHDGGVLVAVGYWKNVMVSLDFGETWNGVFPDALWGQGWSWKKVACSSDCSTIVGVAENGYIWISRDSGSTWTQKGHKALWNAVTCSDDGSVIVAGADNEVIYVSRDHGETWLSRDVDQRIWTDVACSSDGSRIIASTSSGSTNNVYTSSDYGATWSSNLLNLGMAWSVASSSDGARLVVVSYSNGGPAMSGVIYTSSDYGKTWKHETSTPSTQMNWRGVASSSDGIRLAAVAEKQGSSLFGIFTINREGACECCDLRMEKLGLNSRECTEL